MKEGNWVPVDKNCRYLLPKNRPYTKIEAVISYSIDMDEEKEKSISDYARIWDWSRNKVRKFLENKRTAKGQQKDSKRTAKGQTFRFINNDLERHEDSERTAKGQQKDSKRTVTIKPKPKPNTNIKEKDFIFILSNEDEIRRISNEVCISEQETKQWINRIFNYCKNAGYKYKDLAAVIRTWKDRDNKPQPEIKPMSNAWNRN